MIGVSEIRAAILADLLYEPLDMYRLAAGLGEPPFRVRAELKAMRRDQLVRDRIANGRIEWMLTNRGERLANEHNQTAMLGTWS